MHTFLCTYAHVDLLCIGVAGFCYIEEVLCIRWVVTVKKVVHTLRAVRKIKSNHINYLSSKLTGIDTLFVTFTIPWDKARGEIMT